MIEVWIDGCFLLEVMTPEIAAAYRTLMSPESLRALRTALAAGLPPAAIAAAAREQAAAQGDRRRRAAITFRARGWPDQPAIAKGSNSRRANFQPSEVRLKRSR